MHYFQIRAHATAGGTLAINTVWAPTEQDAIRECQEAGQQWTQPHTWQAIRLQAGADFRHLLPGKKEHHPQVLVALDLTDADLTGQVLQRVQMPGVQLRGATLAATNLCKANLYMADLARADLRGADLSGARIEAADLSGADLTGANLAGANLQGACFSRAWLAGANLVGADLRGTDPGLASSLAGATVQGAHMPKKITISAGCVMAGVDFTRCRF